MFHCGCSKNVIRDLQLDGIVIDHKNKIDGIVFFLGGAGEVPTLELTNGSSSMDGCSQS